ncbi:recombinase family protein [Nocardia fluminea]|uniref:DNA invertase Pin-like site-specific DNA recombinase n=1 Tax=Nocardia fluminea TaxID=134984 RepID=A0A2N3VLP8_9NOCA|nr:recombinase family protein [Nocardia fluminea]PKV82556.1 DNA invertase Pin-like site-specific DNA recombinase [Nocardia fluminea]
MANGPEQFRQWAAGGRLGIRAGQHGATDDDGSVIHRMAFAGRTSTGDLQDPTLSMPRQYSNTQLALPEGGVITAHFWDIESGRKDTADRGQGNLHEQFDIPVPRDGGIQDLLAEALRPDRRFDYVICESIERIARRTHAGTDIEQRLEKAGVRLLAADEPFRLDHTGNRKEKRATQTLTRRVKQGIAEFYVMEMLEKSWDGFAVHTEAGYNVGKACYGYRAKLVSHPVPAKRARGQKKTLLEPHPDQAATVQRIFWLRNEERLSYQAIADHLNLDLSLNPPPVPVDPRRAVGRWTPSNVREILNQPKYTGHMVWNRRARKSNGGKYNPPSDWVWSEQPVHESLITVETFLTAQKRPPRETSRRTTVLNSHPETKRSYLFRSYLCCDHCDRRMFGKTRRVAAYYVCAPKKGYREPTHPTAGSFFVREQGLIEHLNTFLNEHVFGPYRRSLLVSSDLDASLGREREQKIAALRRDIVEVGTRSKRLIRSLELMDDPDDEMIADITTRRAELRDEQSRLRDQLAELEAQNLLTPNPGLLDALPTGTIDIQDLPEELARSLFESLRLEIRYNKAHHRATYRITLVGQSLAATSNAVRGTLTARSTRAHRPAGQTEPARQLQRAGSVPIFSVPPAGFEPATSWFQGVCRSCPGG